MSSDAPSTPAWTTLSLCLLAAMPVSAQPTPLRQTQADSYTRYELEAPGSRSFRILYDVTVTTPGARVYFNAIRPGSEPTVHDVTDLATGNKLGWRIVDGKQAASEGLVGAGEGQQYIRVALKRPVPKLELGGASVSPSAGEVRLRIDKSYRDPASYSFDRDRITFERSLGIRRNSVVLPAGYELTRCNVPAQVDREPDGRIRLSFMNRGPGAAALKLEGRKLTHRSSDREAARGSGALTRVPPSTGTSTRSLPVGARADFVFRERAFQDREIVYFLQQPETHSFRLFHDYTETRVGMDRYLNVVRPGSKASSPAAWNLDTGARLEVETLRGQEIAERGIELGRTPQPETEVVVIWFEPVKKGGSVRLRIEETYTDATRYGIDQDELLWDRSFGRPRNAVVLPHGWQLTTSSIPATIRQLDDGRIRLDFENDRPGEIAVYLRAVRR